MPKPLDLLYEGKAKKIFRTEQKDVLFVTYKDDATAYNAQKRGTIQDKGVVNNTMSARMFQMLEQQQIPTHFLELIDDRSMLVKAVEIVPLEIVIRNISAGSLAKRLGIEEGIPFKIPVLDLHYKSDELGDPLINEYHIQALDFARLDEMESIKKYAFQINDILQAFFKKVNLQLIDFKLEFGRYHGEIILADEISPDTCRLWDTKTNEKMDKDRFRRDLGQVEEAYQEVLKRVTEERSLTS